MKPQTPELIGLSYSPWTEKARWALDHHHVPYRYKEHLIFFGMPALHWKAREFGRSLTVPLLVEQSGNRYDSFEIARFAETKGSGDSLFPEPHLETIREINTWSEEALDAGRAMLLRRLLSSPEALAEAVPRFLQGKLGPLTGPVAKFGARYIGVAFGSNRRTPAENHERQRRALSVMREKLHLSGNQTLLGEFSYADVCLATALQMVSPVSDEFLPIGPATRKAWTDEQLAAEFADLLQWRDALYRKYRPLRNEVSRCA